MRTPGWSLAASLACTLPLACAEPCHDDGFGQAQCPSPQADAGHTSDPSTDGDDTEGTTTASTDTDVMTGSQGGGAGWCADQDGDDFGDPDDCVEALVQPPGTVDNDEDCDDADPRAFPGVAFNEADPTLCMRDEDGDGWGDASPSGRIVAGADCIDSSSTLNPGKLALMTVMPDGATDASTPRTLVTIDPSDGGLATFAKLELPGGAVPPIDVDGIALRDDGTILVNDVNGVALAKVSYASTCQDDRAVVSMLEPFGTADDTVCGLTFDDSRPNRLYGIGATGSELRGFDPATGEQMTAKPLSAGSGLLDVGACDLARDCAKGRLLLAEGKSRTLYALPEGPKELAEATVVRDLSTFFPEPWEVVGLEYDPVTQSAYLSTGSALYLVPLEGTAGPTLVHEYDQDETVGSLQYLPVCE